MSTVREVVAEFPLGDWAEPSPLDDLIGFLNQVRENMQIGQRKQARVLVRIDSYDLETPGELVVILERDKTPAELAAEAAQAYLSQEIAERSRKFRAEAWAAHHAKRGKT